MGIACALGISPPRQCTIPDLFEMSALPAIPPDIAIITGPTMLGICLTWGFMGLTLVQVYIYFTTFFQDPRGLKWLVFSLFILDVLQTVMVTADAFHWFVFGFGNMIQLNDTFLNSWDVPMLDGIISLIVQLFYCWRIYILRGSIVIPAAIGLVSLTQCVAGIVTAVKAHMLGQLSLISTEVVEQTLWLVGGAVADVAIAAVLCYTLLTVRNAGFKRSHSIITRIVQMTVETNALTASVALLGLVLFWAVPQHSTLVVPPTAIIGKLYTNSLIAVLNNRVVGSTGVSAYGHGSSQQNAGNTGLGTTASMNLPAFRVPGGGGGGGGGGPQSPVAVVDVHVVRTQTTYHDGDDMEMSDMEKGKPQAGFM
ncbi:unnamed protein product [Mycena citricolor]|uniref:DUF6534 domain-containing protein n=1 Tax=Mycena citricolor TaxID=2018698 RepID=A0AAD2K0V1_9AGAR|nr:unnamed protein product [Mycena citricolor]